MVATIPGMWTIGDADIVGRVVSLVHKHLCACLFSYTTFFKLPYLYNTQCLHYYYIYTTPNAYTITISIQHQLLLHKNIDDDLFPDGMGHRGHSPHLYYYYITTNIGTT